MSQNPDDKSVKFPKYEMIIPLRALIEAQCNSITKQCCALIELKRQSADLHVVVSKLIKAVEELNKVVCEDIVKNEIRDEGGVRLDDPHNPYTSLR